MSNRAYYVYIAASLSRVLYIGVTNDLERRAAQHRDKLILGFTAKYNIKHLVYFEQFDYIDQALAREKQLKGWTRAKKIRLIEQLNPDWDDLSVDSRSAE